jgi:signal peptidase I
MSFFKSEKFQKIFYPIFYILFSAAITLSGCFIFSRYYYTNIFVSGPSMLPTLVGDDTHNIHHYGIADTTSKAIDSLKRFDVVITYYPSSWGAKDGLIVKRVWGFPGETINLVSDLNGSTFTVSRNGNEIYSITATTTEFDVNMISKYEHMQLYEFNIGKKIFRTHYSHKVSGDAGMRNIHNLTLAENQYFVMGDNWVDSTDCYTKMSQPEKLTRSDIQGRVICIQGYGKVDRQDTNVYKIVDKVSISPIYNF